MTTAATPLDKSIATVAARIRSGKLSLRSLAALRDAIREVGFAAMLGAERAKQRAEDADRQQAGKPATALGPKPAAGELLRRAFAEPAAEPVHLVAGRDHELERLAARFAHAAPLGDAVTEVERLRAEWQQLRDSSAGTSFRTTLDDYVRLHFERRQRDEQQLADDRRRATSRRTPAPWIPRHDGPQAAGGAL